MSTWSRILRDRDESRERRWMAEWMMMMLLLVLLLLLLLMMMMMLMLIILMMMPVIIEEYNHFNSDAKVMYQRKKQRE